MERLAEGFAVHHADGDHWNDTPSNLVLIEGTDHTRLHNAGAGLFHLLESVRRKDDARIKRAETEGRAAYERRAKTGRWVGLPNSATYWAKVYALSHQLEWPPCRAA